MNLLIKNRECNGGKLINEKCICSRGSYLDDGICKIKNKEKKLKNKLK